MTQYWQSNPWRNAISSDEEDCYRGDDPIFNQNEGRFKGFPGDFQLEKEKAGIFNDRGVQ